MSFVAVQCTAVLYEGILCCLNATEKTSRNSTEVDGSNGCMTLLSPSKHAVLRWTRGPSAN
eukprot:3532963-Amphidinium_carterae.1